MIASIPGPIQTAMDGRWQNHVSRLDGMGLPLVPCEGKSPGLMPAWETNSFTPEQLIRQYSSDRRVTGIGVRGGCEANGLLAIDIDGATAIEWCRQHGVKPSEIETWMVTRPDEPARLKLLFWVPRELWHHFRDGRLKIAYVTKPGTKKVREQVELFFHPGQQVLITGTHPDGAPYQWPAGRGPEDLIEIPPEVFELCLQVVSKGKVPRKQTINQPAPERDALTLETVRRALDLKDPAMHHDDWVKIGMALHSWDPIEGLEEWDRWSSSAQNYPGREALEVKWRSFKADGGITIGSVLDALNGQRPPTSTRTAAAGAKAKPSPAKVVDITEARKRIREGLEGDASQADLQQLQAELVQEADLAPISLQRLTEAEQRQLEVAASIQAEARALEAERDRQDIGQALTLQYLLPPAVADAISITTRSLPTDGPSAALPYLTTLAGLVKLGTQVEALRSVDYVVPVNLYTCLVGRSGAKKSPVGRLLLVNPIKPLCREMARCNRNAVDQWREENRGLKPAERSEPPFPRRVYISESTGEALAAQLEAQEESGLGLLIHRDELSGLFGSFNQYRKGSGADEQQLLEAYDGSGMTSVRISRSRYYSQCQLSIYGTTQPAVLRELVANGDASGLWARFLFVPLPEQVVPLPTDETEQEKAAGAKAAQLLADICDNVYRMPRRSYRLSSAAKERFAQYEANHQREALKATIGAVSALYGKSAGKVLRVAGLLHLLQIACGETTSQVIEADTIDRATALVDHLDSWALTFHSEVATGGMGDLMRTVHRVAEAAGGAIKWREFQNRITRKQRKEVDAAAFAEAAKALAAGGYGVVDAGARGSISYRASRPLP